MDGGGKIQRAKQISKNYLLHMLHPSTRLDSRLWICTSPQLDWEQLTQGQEWYLIIFLFTCNKVCSKDALSNGLWNLVDQRLVLYLTISRDRVTNFAERIFTSNDRSVFIKVLIISQNPEAKRGVTPSHYFCSHSFSSTPSPACGGPAECINHPTGTKV